VTDPIRRAYAVLGLEPGASERQVRKSYRALVKKWHPDRHASDPQGQAEAAQRMREINKAYDTILEHTAPKLPIPPRSQSDGSAPGSPAGTGRLSREQIEAMVQAIGTEGPLEIAFGTLDAWRGRLGGCLAVLYVIAVIISLAAARRLWTKLDLLLLLVAGVIAGAALIHQRLTRKRS
jgi:curved DNA-binding protein CbpA